MIGTSGINVANCYKQYGGSVSILQVKFCSLDLTVTCAIRWHHGLIRHGG